MAKAIVAFDIETLGTPVTQAEIDRWVEKETEKLSALTYPGPPSNYRDPTKIAEHEVEWHANKATKIESLPAQAISAIENDEKRKFSHLGMDVLCVGVGQVDPFANTVKNLYAILNPDPKQVAREFVELMNDNFEEFTLVGWNSDSFDLPILLKAIWQAKVKLRYRIKKWGTVDLKRHPFNNRSLKDTARSFGITPPVEDVDGASVAKMFEAGEYKRIKEYCKSDVYITGMLYCAATAMFEL